LFRLLNRGNVRATVYHEPQDYDAVVALISDTGLRVPMWPLGYCLMPDHLDLAPSPREAGDLSHFIRRLLITGVFCYLWHHHPSGHVGQDGSKHFDRGGCSPAGRAAVHRIPHPVSASVDH
jgi:putative transposase